MELIKGRTAYVVEPAADGWQVVVEGIEYQVTRDPARICLARKADGSGLCQKWSEAGRERCKFHGGASPIGVDSPHFLHGTKSRWVSRLPGRIGEIAAGLEDDDFAGLEGELLVLKALLITRLEALPGDGASLDDATLKGLDILLRRIESVVSTIQQLRNSTALTEAEVAFLSVSLQQLMLEFVPPERYPQFSRRLRQLIGHRPGQDLPPPLGDDEIEE